MKTAPLYGKNVQRARADLPFLYRFNVKGETYSGETHETNLAKAEKFAAARKQDVLTQNKRNVALGLDGSVTFEQACQLWWSEQGRHNVNSDHAASVLDWLRAHLNGGREIAVQDIRAQHVTAVREARRDTERACPVNGTRKVMDSTVNHTLSTLRAVLRHAHLMHSAPLAPIAWDKIMLSLGEVDIRVLTEEEFSRILGALRADLHDVVAFALASAKRINEILTLTWRQIDWSVAHPTMRLTTKGDKYMLDPLGPVELEVLKRQYALQVGQNGEQPSPDARVFTFVAQLTRTYRTVEGVVTRVAGKRYPLDYQQMRASWDSAAKETCGIDVSLHDLRHTAATWMLRAGVPIQDVSRALNHANIAVTLKHYGKVTATEVDKAKKMIAEKVAVTVAVRSAPVLKLVEPRA